MLPCPMVPPYPSELATSLQSPCQAGLCPLGVTAALLFTFLPAPRVLCTAPWVTSSSLGDGYSRDGGEDALGVRL